MKNNLYLMTSVLEGQESRFIIGLYKDNLRAILKFAFEKKDEQFSFVGVQTCQYGQDCLFGYDNNLTRGYLIQVFPRTMTYSVQNTEKIC